MKGNWYENGFTRDSESYSSQKTADLYDLNAERTLYSNRDEEF